MAQATNLSPEEVKRLVGRYRLAQSTRTWWEQQWQDIKELVLCDTTDFNRMSTPGFRRYDIVFDGTAIDACEEFACGLHAYLSNPSERWFELGVVSPDGKGMMDLRRDPRALRWLEDVADIIYAVYSDPRTNFSGAFHEHYLDLGAFGTGVNWQEWDQEEGHIVFNSYALAQHYFEQNSRGVIDRAYRKFIYNGDQMCDHFGNEPGWEQSKAYDVIKTAGNQRAAKTFEMVHIVTPRDGRDPWSQASGGMRYASYWINTQTMEVHKESGFRMRPFCASRWVKSSEEVYGRGPGMKCLPDIKVLQIMERVMLKAGQKSVDPAMVVPDDGFILPIKTAPGSVNFKEPGAEKIEFLEFVGDVKFGLEQSNQKREQIQKAFHSDWFKRFRKNREQSATEVEDDRDEMLRFLAPMLGRQQSELLGPTIARTYDILSDRQMIPPAPDSIRGRRLGVLYISPAARAQQGVKADRISRFMMDLQPLAQANPEVMDAVNTDEMIAVYAEVRGVSRRVLRSPQEISAIRQRRDRQQQVTEGAKAAESASQATLNLAQATKANPASTGSAPA